MKVQVYFFIEVVEEMLIRNNKTNDQVLFSLYVLVWELKLKNILNVGRILVKLKKRINLVEFQLNKKNPFSNFP